MKTLRTLRTNLRAANFSRMITEGGWFFETLDFAHTRSPKAVVARRVMLRQRAARRAAWGC